jgi:transposase
LRASISRTAPSECSTAGRQRLGGISRAGDERLRQLLVLEATAVIQYTKPGRPATSPWLLNLLSRKPRKPPQVPEATILTQSVPVRRSEKM